MPTAQPPLESQQSDTEQQNYPTRRYVVLVSIFIPVLVAVGVSAVVWVWSISLPIALAILAVLLTILVGALVVVVRLVSSTSQKEELPTPKTAFVSSPSEATLQVDIVNTPPIRYETWNAPTMKRSFESGNGSPSVRTESGPLAMPRSSYSGVRYQPPLSPLEAFPYNQPLKSEKEFFGRTREVQTLLDRTRKRTSTSIVGEAGIGKTWLMSYFQLIARTELGDRFRIGSINATSRECSNITTFTTYALQVLGVPFTTNGSDAWGLILLEKAVRELQSRDQTPILCIDDFDGFTGKAGFDLKFFENLRAITYMGLVLIVASKLPLNTVVGKMDQEAINSPFFNIFTQVKLKPFNIKEAAEFVRAKAKQVDLDERECDILLQYSAKYSNERDVYETDREKHWPPSRLQLAGQLLLHDKTADPQKVVRSDYWLRFMEELNEAYSKEQVVHEI